MIGKRFGDLLVIERYGSKSLKSGEKRIYWICKCSCGNIVEKCGKLLRNGTTKSCGCLRSKTGLARMKEMTKQRRESALIKVPGRGIGTGICEICGQEIKKPSPEKFKFCSMDCYSKKNTFRKKITCKRCGKVCEKTQTDFMKSLNHYCSKECSILDKQDGFGQFRGFIRRAMRHLDKRKLALDIKPEDLKVIWEKQEGICPYTGWKLRINQKGRRPNNASLDRIDSTKGYSTDNVQFVALIANYAKNNFSEEQLFDFCLTVSKYRLKDRFISINDFDNKRITNNIFLS